jgi:Flp pilus assembly protein CpaB
VEIDMARLFVETAPSRGRVRRKAAAGILAIVFAIILAGCNRPAAPPADQNRQVEPATSSPTPPETVEVWVAARDLPVGTVISRSDLETLAVKKKIPKDALPPAYVASEEELFDKRLTRAIYQHATFDPAALGKNVALQLPPGLDLVAISLPADSSAARTAIPGSKVDVTASMKVGANTHSFLLLADVLVVAVDTYLTDAATQLAVSVAATQEQALLLALARQRECKLDLTRRDPNEPANPPYDIRKVRALLQNNASPPKQVNPEVNRLKAETEPAPAPAPRELVKVASVIGPPRVTELVAQQEPEIAPMPRPVVPKKFRDVTVTTSSGARIHRFEEFAPGKFKLVGIFDPEVTPWRQVAP